MKRRFITVGIALVILIVAIVVANRRSIRVSYHHWRMNSAYNTLFGDPQSAGNGLASHDVTGIDVDAVIARYESHRQHLVDLKALAYVQANLVDLASDGTEQQSDARSEFVRRMWARFPEHRHYNLDGNGKFETWVSVATENDWREFLELEVAKSKLAADNRFEENKEPIEK